MSEVEFNGNYYTEETGVYFSKIEWLQLKDQLKNGLYAKLKDGVNVPFCDVLQVIDEVLKAD